MAGLQQQLDQVNAALVGMPDNEMLLKLKADIEETFKLAQEVATGPGSGGGNSPDSASAGASEPAGGVESAAGSAASAGASAAGTSARTWRAGDTVQAKYSADGMMYEATVVAASGTDSYTVKFSAGGIEMVRAEDVLPPKSTRMERAQTISGETGKSSTTGILSTDTAAQRAAKKKAAKGKRSYERRKEQEEALNAGKKNWKDFMNGAKSSKKRGGNRGIARKSIFTTPYGPSRSNASTPAACRLLSLMPPSASPPLSRLQPLLL